jgi:hypothetical protein
MFSVYGGSNGLEDLGEGNHCDDSGRIDGSDWIDDSGGFHRPEQRWDDCAANYGRWQYNRDHARDYHAIPGPHHDT